MDPNLTPEASFHINVTQGVSLTSNLTPEASFNINVTPGVSGNLIVPAPAEDKVSANLIVPRRQSIGQPGRRQKYWSPSNTEPALAPHCTGTGRRL